MECRFGLPQLIVHKAGGGATPAALALQCGQFENLAFSLCLRVRVELLANALAVQPARNAENDLPGGVREFRDDEFCDLFMTDLPRQLANLRSRNSNCW